MTYVGTKYRTTNAGTREWAAGRPVLLSAALIPTCLLHGGKEIPSLEKKTKKQGNDLYAEGYYRRFSGACLLIS